MKTLYQYIPDFYNQYDKQFRFGNAIIGLCMLIQVVGLAVIAVLVDRKNLIDALNFIVLIVMPDFFAFFFWGMHVIKYGRPIKFSVVSKRQKRYLVIKKREYELADPFYDEVFVIDGCRPHMYNVKVNLTTGQRIISFYRERDCEDFKKAIQS